jgi:hypothetical protein
MREKLVKMIENFCPLQSSWRVLEPLSSSRLAKVTSHWNINDASSDIQTSKILELSGVQSKLRKAMILFVGIDTVYQS